MSIRKSAGIVIGIILVLMSLPMTTHNSLIDRINPIVQETTSYAEVPKSTQKYTMFKYLTKKRQAKRIKKTGHQKSSSIMASFLI